MQEKQDKGFKTTSEIEGGNEISQYRQAAQQKSIDAISGAKERYNMAKETLSQGSQNTSDYAGEKAKAAAETGKGTAGYIGNVATTVKDKAVVAGWGAAEFTADKVVGATKAVGSATAGAAGYVGQTAVAAKDKVGSVGVTAKDYAAHGLASAKETVVATEESVKDYAARKRAEAERDIQAKQSTEKYDDVAGAGRETMGSMPKPIEESSGGVADVPGGGVLRAIGETVMEIGQITKELLVGKGETQTTDTIQESAEHKK